MKLFLTPRGAEHAMDDRALGEHTGELVYNWFYDV